MISIVKSDGSTEAFDVAKLIGSLLRAGASDDAAQQIAGHVEQEIRDGMTTHEIYSRAFSYLREHRHAAAARYSLKRAVLEFGPSGFPFEAYLAELFRTKGYEAVTDTHVQGRCVEHEVDVLMRKGEETVVVEAKFHNTVGFKTDLQVALYVRARVQDIEESEKYRGRHIRGLLVTNTKFTSLATQYAKCHGLELLGWEYPADHNLHDFIEEVGLYPITALTTLSKSEKMALLADKVVLCRDLARHEDALARAGISEKRNNEILMEAGSLCEKPVHN